MNIGSMPSLHSKCGAGLIIISYGLAVCAGFLCFPGQSVFANQTASDISQAPTVVAPGSLTERERAGLDKKYQFDVRGKSQLLVPSTSARSVSVDELSPFDTYGERYRRYLSAAIDMFKSGKFEEAEKVLLYLNKMDPDDDYVKSYLTRVKKEMRSTDTRWKNEAASEAASMKKEKIKVLLREGIDSFNNKDFDNALSCFYDVLSIDPKNTKALSYMKKLKTYYPKKLEVEEITSNWEMTKASGGGNELLQSQKTPSSSLEALADKLLDQNGSRFRNITGSTRSGTKAGQFVLEERADALLGEAAFGLEIDAIMAAKRAEENRADQMILGVGDILRISVSNHAELSGDVTVQSNGAVTLPLTGDEIMTMGCTVEELAERIKQVVDKYIEAPMVSVYMISGKSQIFYVIDEVSCTPYPITRPDLTLRDALFLSDWGDNRALGRVIVIKPSARNPIIRKIDTFDMIFRGNLKNNIRISNGDVIYIPLTAAAKVTKVVSDTIAPFQAMQNAKQQWIDNKWNQEGYENLWRIPRNADQAAVINAGFSSSNVVQ